MNRNVYRGLFLRPFFRFLLRLPNRFRAYRLLSALLFLLIPWAPQLIMTEELKVEVFSPAAHYAHTERENVRVYRGQHYQGLQYRGRRVYLQQTGSSLVDNRIDSSASGSDQIYQGSVYLIKTLTRDAVRVLQPIDREISIKCRVSHQGFTPIEDSELPMRTGFPVLAKGDIEPGDTWEAQGRDSVYLEDGVLISQPFQCTYTYRGTEMYMERMAQIIDFTYTFSKADPYSVRPRALRGTGSGEIALFTGEKGGYFIKERLTRHYLENGTPSSREEGFRLTWGRGITLGEIESLERTMVAALQGEKDDPGQDQSQQSQGRSTGQESGQEPGGQVDQGQEPGDRPRRTGQAGQPEEPSGQKEPAGRADLAGRTDKGEKPEDEQIEVERTTEGIKLNLPRIHFVPDQARILPREKDRLDKLANLLEKVPEASFMVKGHTADVGSKASQYELSVERARTIIEEMVARGLEPSRFVYQGLGGDEPVAPNDTEAGRARNRRVEVIILNQ